MYMYGQGWPGLWSGLASTEGGLILRVGLWSGLASTEGGLILRVGLWSG